MLFTPTRARAARLIPGFWPGVTTTTGCAPGAKPGHAIGVATTLRTGTNGPEPLVGRDEGLEVSCCLARECEASIATVASHRESASARSLREACACSRAVLRHSRIEHDHMSRPQHADSAGSPRTARRHRWQPGHNERRAHAWAGMAWSRSMITLNALASLLGWLGGSTRTRRATHRCKHVATGAR